jgi:GrpB-like predicted nucleotidyltransferase (UPF0157 family)
MPLSNSDDHWREQFALERIRLLATLGELTERGIVENVQHIGATSVSGLPARPCVDLGLSVWPFPLAPDRVAALNALGYELIPGHEDVPEQRFRHSTDAFQLFFVEAGSELSTDYLVIREYLRHNDHARQAYSARKREWATSTISPSTDRQAVKAQFFDQMLDEARRWWVDHQGFSPVDAVANELREFQQPWYVSSGWALDLFLGHVTRVHHDVDVVVARTDQLALQQYLIARGWKLLAPSEGRLEPWPLHEYLEQPCHQVHAHRDGAFTDFLLSDVRHGVWQYRRNPAVIRTVDRMCLHTDRGIPFLAPELILLFKSKNTGKNERNKDQVDFERTCIRLEPERRAWLRWALLATDPAHPWIERLA